MNGDPGHPREAALPPGDDHSCKASILATAAQLVFGHVDWGPEQRQDFAVRRQASVHLGMSCRQRLNLCMSRIVAGTEG